MVTVKDIIEALKKFDENAPLEIAITQFNKRYPVAFLEPEKSIAFGDSYATKMDGIHVRLSISLPVSREENTFAFLVRRKIIK